MIIGNAASERQGSIVVNEGINDRDLTVGTSSNNMATNENTRNVKTLERCFNESIDREMSTIVDTVEDRIQNANLTAIDNIVAPKIELAIRSINASSGRDATSLTANSERVEHVGIITSFENASRNNKIRHVSNVNDETRHNIPDEVSELSVPETHFDRQTHTHHTDCLPDCPRGNIYHPLHLICVLTAAFVREKLSDEKKLQIAGFIFKKIVKQMKK